MKCNKCNLIKSLTDFHPSDVKRRKSGICKSCKQVIYKERDYNGKQKHYKRNTDPEHRKMLAKKHYDKKRDEILIKTRKPENRLKVRLRRYGVTLKQYEEALKRSNGKCENSGCNKPATDIDHKHGTKGSIRGLMCNTCNRALGYLYDNPEIIKGLLDYLNTRTIG